MRSMLLYEELEHMAHVTHLLTEHMSSEPTLSARP